MEELIIDFDHISLRPGFPNYLREKLDSAGLRSGRFTVGNVPVSPEMVYFLWHEAGQEPISMLFPRDQFNDEASLCEALREFLNKWRRRIE